MEIEHNGSPRACQFPDARIGLRVALLAWVSLNFETVFEK